LISLGKVDFAAGEELVRKAAALFRQLGDVQQADEALALLRSDEPEPQNPGREAEGKSA
jgi:hypothetical protein